MSTCLHMEKYLAFREAKNGTSRHLGLYCPQCRRFVPDERGKYWQSQKGIVPLSSIPVIKEKE
jgi:hypothetical protein